MKMQLLKKVPYYEIPIIADKGTIRTFKKRIYSINGMIVKDIKTGNLYKISEIYYDIRTIKTRKGQVIAKRKNPNDELMRLA